MSEIMDYLCLYSCKMGIKYFIYYNGSNRSKLSYLSSGYYNPEARRLLISCTIFILLFFLPLKDFAQTSKSKSAIDKKYGLSKFKLGTSPSNFSNLSFINTEDNFNWYFCTNCRKSTYLGCKDLHVELAFWKEKLTKIIIYVEYPFYIFANEDSSSPYAHYDTNYNENTYKILLNSVISKISFVFGEPYEIEEPDSSYTLRAYANWAHNFVVYQIYKTYIWEGENCILIVDDFHYSNQESNKMHYLIRFNMSAKDILKLKAESEL